MHGDEAHERPRLAGEGQPVTDDPQVGRADPRLHRHLRQPGPGQRQRDGQGVVEAVAGPGDRHQALGPPRREGGVDRQVEVGGVLGRRVALDRGARGLGGGQRRGVHGVHVAHDHVDGQPEGERALQTGVGRHHPRGRAEVAEVAGVDRR